MNDRGFHVMHPDYVGEPDPPSTSRRAPASRSVTVHWLDADNNVMRTSVASVPRALLIGTSAPWGTAQLPEDVPEVWWDTLGRIFTQWPPPRRRPGGGRPRQKMTEDDNS